MTVALDAAALVVAQPQAVAEPPQQQAGVGAAKAAEIAAGAGEAAGC